MKELTGKYGYLCLEGEYYEADTIDGKPIFTKIDKRKLKNRIRMVELIAEKIQDKVDIKAILKESMMTKLEEKDIKTLYEMMFKKKKNYTVKTREHHCVDVKIGNFILPVVD